MMKRPMPAQVPTRVAAAPAARTGMLKRPMPAQAPAPAAMPAARTGIMKRPPQAYAKGGSVSTRADGIAKKGKTKCKMV